MGKVSASAFIAAFGEFPCGAQLSVGSGLVSPNTADSTEMSHSYGHYYPHLNIPQGAMKCPALHPWEGNPFPRDPPCPGNPTTSFSEAWLCSPRTSLLSSHWRKEHSRAGAAGRWFSPPWQEVQKPGSQEAGRDTPSPRVLLPRGRRVSED